MNLIIKCDWSDELNNSNNEIARIEQLKPATVTEDAGDAGDAQHPARWLASVAKATQKVDEAEKRTKTNKKKQTNKTRQVAAAIDIQMMLFILISSDPQPPVTSTTVATWLEIIFPTSNSDAIFHIQYSWALPSSLSRSIQFQSIWNDLKWFIINLPFNSAYILLKRYLSYYYY